MKITKLAKSLMIASALVLTVGCQRIETGEVGVRIDTSKQISGTELLPGSFNQTVFGSVLTFPVKDITIEINNRTPLTKDNSALEDFDFSAVYSINPASVAELYSTKAKSFHTFANGDWYLMFNYISTLLNNASYKAVRNFNSLELADNRQQIEREILDTVNEQLKSEGLGNSITVSVVQVRNILPNKKILDAASEYVKAQNELRVKTTEVEIARKESERMAALAQNSTQSIAYMNAQANLTIAEAVKNGKVNAIIIPHGMTMLGALK